MGTDSAISPKGKRRPFRDRLRGRIARTWGDSRTPTAGLHKITRCLQVTHARCGEREGQARYSPGSVWSGELIHVWKIFQQMDGTLAGGLPLSFGHVRLAIPKRDAIFQTLAATTR